jgi:hypothetical protein
MKKKVIRLTESEIISLVKKVIQEQLGAKIRRRSGEIQDFVDMFIANENPEDYNDEFEYADNILYGVYDDLIERYPDLDKYDEEIMDYLKETYGELLFDIWNESSSEEDEDEEYED